MCGCVDGGGAEAGGGTGRSVPLAPLGDGQPVARSSVLSLQLPPAGLQLRGSALLSVRKDG